MEAFTRFPPDLQKFLGELKTHNNRAWFEENKARYERVYKVSFSAFVTAVGPRLAKISSELVADPKPSGGSVMRIYRDTRFSPDKSPYRTYTVVHFGHRKAGEGMAPGLFLYVSPEEVSAGGGLWHPETAVAQKIRSAIVADPRAWQAATASAGFRTRFELTGESLKRPPPGVPKDHALLADLVRKDFVASTDLTKTEFTSPQFLSTFDGIGRQVSPLLRFLCKAIGLPF